MAETGTVSGSRRGYPGLPRDRFGELRSLRGRTAKARGSVMLAACPREEGRPGRRGVRPPARPLVPPTARDPSRDVRSTLRETGAAGQRRYGCRAADSAARRAGGRGWRGLSRAGPTRGPRHAPRAFGGGAGRDRGTPHRRLHLALLTVVEYVEGGREAAHQGVSGARIRGRLGVRPNAQANPCPAMFPG